jgi:hypothetical protein
MSEATFYRYSRVLAVRQRSVVLSSAPSQESERLGRAGLLGPVRWRRLLPLVVIAHSCSRLFAFWVGDGGTADTGCVVVGTHAGIGIFGPLWPSWRCVHFGVLGSAMVCLIRRLTARFLYAKGALQFADLDRENITPLDI